MRRLLMAFCILLFSPMFSASALDSSGKRKSSDITVNVNCTVGQNRFALAVVFDRWLDREQVEAAVGSGLLRAGLQESSCDQPQTIESNEPPENVAAIDSGLRRLTLIVSSGGAPEAKDVEEPTYGTIFDEQRAHISIDDTGKWMARQRGADCLTTRCRHGPTSNSYYNPRQFMNCAKGIATDPVGSDHLVQILHLRCPDDAPTAHDLLFFGLSRFAYARQDGTASSIDIQEAAFLALEFEVKRTVAALPGFQ